MLLVRLRTAVGGLPPIFWTLVAGLFVNRLASFVATFLALYLVRERGFAPAAAGRVVALFGAGVLVAGPSAGHSPTPAARGARRRCRITPRG